MKESTWGVVQKLGLIIEGEPRSNAVLYYGTSDPLPNPAELLLTQLVASRYGLHWQFFVYRHGKNLLSHGMGSLPRIPGVFYLEEIMSEDLTLGELAQQIWTLRGEPVIVAHFGGGSGKVIRATSKPTASISGVTIRDLHQSGGWIGGSAIHYFLRRLTEEVEDAIFPCPFQEKGRVYRIYKGVSRPVFILTPFVHLIPPTRLGLPSWAPTPWSYWISLPASYRRLVRKELADRIFSGEERIEIRLP